MYPPSLDEGPFTIEKLNRTIDTLHPNKAGGPDELISELFKDLDNDNRHNILWLYNEIYENQNIPDYFHEALVVQLDKPGKSPEHYSSYRPITLLNVTYKIMAKLTQERLGTALDSRIVDFQYGYKQGRSTAEPIFIARRIQEIAERHGLQLFLLALDYSKALDSIPHDRLVESLHRLGAPRGMIRLMEMLYVSPNLLHQNLRGYQ